MCGILLLARILQICSPSTVIDIEALEKQLEKVTLESCGGNYVDFTTELKRLYNQINIDAGYVACTEQKLGRIFFAGCKTWLNKEWIAAVGNVHTEWLLKRSVNLDQIMIDLGTIVSNLKTLDEWNNREASDSKQIALMTDLAKNQKKLKRQVDAMNGQKQALAHDRSGQKEKNNRQFKKVGQFANHPVSNAKYVWCDDHGKTGCYMPHPHDHAAWKKKKEEKQSRYEAGKKDRRSKRQKTSAKDDKSDEGNDSSLPRGLQLKEAVRTVLTTRLCTSAEEAERLGDEILTSCPDF